MENSHQLNGFGSNKILSSAINFIGHTPMIRLNKIPREEGVKCEVLAKCELFSVGGSHKDRIALRMIEDAEKKGLLIPGVSTIIEPTSGNTGISVALVAAVKNYKAILVMPMKMSQEKMDLMKALGAEIIRTPAAPVDSPLSHISVAKRLNKEISNSIVLDQYTNENNSKAHYYDTAEEILDQCDGKIDMIVIGAGTGGAVTGIGQKFKEKCKNCQIVAVDPDGSIMAQPLVLNEATKGNFWEIEGIGHDFIPGQLDLSVIDKWMKVNDKESLLMTRKIIKDEGLLVGGSCGSIVVGAMKAIKEAGLKEGQRCVILLPDGVRNYMSKFVDDKWMLERDFISNPQLESYSWWNKNISLLNLKAPISINPDTQIKKAVEIMEKSGVSQVPVIDNEGQIKGVVTSKELLNRMVGKSFGFEDRVEGVIMAFKKVDQNKTIGKLFNVVRGSQFALVVNEQVQFDSNGVETKKENVTGIVDEASLIAQLANL